MEFKKTTPEVSSDSNEESELITSNICNLLNTQKDNELYNHHLYKQIANYFKINGLPKLHQYYEKRAHEEYNHHNWIVDYMNETNSNITYNPIEIKEESVDFNDSSTKGMIAMFELTIEKELDTTEKIGNIYKAAFDEMDFITSTWLQQQLIPEQHEEEATSLKALQIASQESDWLTKEISILELLGD